MEEVFSVLGNLTTFCFKSVC